MSIIDIERGKKPRRIDPSDFADEDGLQELINDNPETIPLYEAKEDVKLLVLAREFPTDAGPIDALGTDKDGEIYIIETKLYKNPDKRSVVAQALDYGASLWRHGSNFTEFTALLEESVRDKFGVGLHDKLTEFFSLDEAGTDALLEGLSRNLNDGSFKFVVPMDKLHEPLKDLIVFLNQNSRFDFYAVELEYYRLDERIIVIPKLFGAETKKQSGGRTETTWTVETMLADARAKLLPEEFKVFEFLWAFFRKDAELGRGSTRASFKIRLPSRYGVIPFGEVTAKGTINVYLPSILAKGISESTVGVLVADLAAVDKGFAAKGDLAHSYSRAGLSALVGAKKTDRFIAAVEKFRVAVK